MDKRWMWIVGAVVAFGAAATLWVEKRKGADERVEEKPAVSVGATSTSEFDTVTNSPPPTLPQQQLELGANGTVPSTGAPVRPTPPTAPPPGPAGEANPADRGLTSPPTQPGYGETTPPSTMPPSTMPPGISGGAPDYPTPMPTPETTAPNYPSYPTYDPPPPPSEEFYPPSVDSDIESFEGEAPIMPQTMPPPSVPPMSPDGTPTFDDFSPPPMGGQPEEEY